MLRFFFSLIVAVSCFCRLLAVDNNSITAVRYWIDNDYTAAKLSSATEFDIDCSQLPPGMHTLNYLVADADGHFSSLQQHSFLKFQTPHAPSKVATLQYWWDDMHSNAVIEPYTADEIVLSAGALPYGLHSLKYRVKDDAGHWSELHTHYFYHGEARDPSRIVSYSYWWNDMNDKTVKQTLDTPTVSFTLDEDFNVPEEARTNYAGHYTATLNICVTDNNGRSSFLTTDVVYPDNDAPTTDIDADKYVTSSAVKISWEELSGDIMGDYNVYFSKDGGPFLLWLPDTTQTSAIFKGEVGSVYLFTVTGRDAFGNREEYDETKCVSVTFE